MEKDKSWRLEELRIKYRDYGEFQGKHLGSVEFKNKSGDAFVFNLTPEKTDEFLKLVAHELVVQGNDLGKNLLNSIGMDRVLSV